MGTLLEKDASSPCGEGQGWGFLVPFAVTDEDTKEPHPRPLPTRGRGVRFALALAP